MQEKVNVIKKEYEAKIPSITSIKTLNDVRVEYLGKQGKVTSLSKMMKDVPNDQKKEFDNVDLGKGVIAQDELLSKRLPEMPAQLVPIIEEIWQEEVVGK